MQQPFTRYAIVIGASLLAACSPPPEPEEEKPDLPPPPTPMEIANSSAREAQIDGPMPVAGAVLAPQIRTQIISIFRKAKVEHGGTEDGDRVLAILASKLADRIALTNEQKLYQHTLTYIDSYEALYPNAARFDHVRNNIIDILTRPRVDVVMIADIKKRRYARMRITKPLEGKTYTVNLEPGEEAHGLRFLEFFADNRGVRMEYLTTGERFNALFDRDE